MKKERKWWKVPVILSAVLGSTPVMFMVIGILYAHILGWQRVVGGLVMLIFILSAIWIPAFIALGIRKLKRKPSNVV